MINRAGRLPRPFYFLRKTGPKAFAEEFQEESVQIVVNGETAIIQSMSVLHYLDSITIDPCRVAVELNLDILPKAEYASTVLKDGDRMEIVHFVGGG